MKFEPVSDIKVGLRFDEETLPVGRLAKRDRKIYFEYENSFIIRGLEISPIECALKPGVHSYDPSLFGGLPGVFNDSLPDGWGRLLLDRLMNSLGILPEVLSPLDGLTHTGSSGMGALVYEPSRTGKISGDKFDTASLAEQMRQTLAGEADDVLDELLSLNGSSSGARPKAVIGLHENKRDVVHGMCRLQAGYEPWLVKFPNTNDGGDAGAIEYVYALMARDAGLAMPDVHLFPSRKGSGYFAVKRFDRQDGKRLHMHTACGLLHSDFRMPSLDYEDLMALTMNLTKDAREVEKMYRLAVFNVLAHNRDDHAKNFSFLMDASGRWNLSPAYDLTFSSGPNGEQSTMVMGEGRNPDETGLVKLGLEAKLPRNAIDGIVEQTRDALSKWKQLAESHGVRRSNIKLIDNAIAKTG